VIQNKDNLSTIIYGCIIVSFTLANLLSSDTRTIFKSLGQFGIWIVIIFIIIGCYGLRYQIKDFYNVAMLNLIPSKVSIVKEGSVAIAKSNNGHYMLTANINSKPVYFLVDTGATDVSLTLDDARRIGVNTDSLIYDQATSTANGINFGANIIISSISVGDIVINNVRGTVVKQGMDTSLLGMSFLSKLTSYSVENEVLVMTKK